MSATHQEESAPVENRLILVAEELDQAVARLARLVEELKGEIKADPDPQSSEQEQP